MPPLWHRTRLQLLEDTPLSTDLTVLLDSLGVLQTLQRLLDKERGFDPLLHQHSAVLEALLSRLNQRTASTMLVKVKSHCGTLLNEAADALADDGTELDPTGPDPAPPTTYLHYLDTSTSDPSKQDPKTRHPDARNKAWLNKLRAWKATSYSDKIDNKTLNHMNRPELNRHHFNSAIRSQAMDMTDTAGKRVLQAYCGAFPTRHKLWEQGQSPTPFCAFCPTTFEHMQHWQCQCPQFRKSRTAAHNFIWNNIAKHLTKRSTYNIITETPMRKTLFRVHEAYRSWQPDGMAMDPTSKTAFLLEFTRCSENRHSPALDAIERKDIKYQPLLESLREHNNRWTFELLTFPIGYLGSIPTDTYHRHLATLNVDDKHHDSIMTTTSTAAMVSFSKMATERMAAINTHTDKPKTRSQRPPRRF